MGINSMLFNDLMDVAVDPYAKGVLHDTIDDPIFREEFIKDPLFGGDDYWGIVHGSRYRSYRTMAA